MTAAPLDPSPADTGPIPARGDRASRHSSASNEHATPIAVVEAARALLDRIDLDPATCALAQSRVQAKYWRGLDHPNPGCRDGLSDEWFGRVFLNPPGGKTNGQSNAKTWWFKLAREHDEGRVEAAIFVAFSIELLQTAQVKPPMQTITDFVESPARPEEHRVLRIPLPTPLDFLICVPARRLEFDAMTHSGFIPGTSPTHANAIVYLPPARLRIARGGWAAEEKERFARAFAAIGRVIG